MDDDTFEKMARRSLTVDIAGRSFRVLALEHLIAMKLHAVKAGDSHRGVKDLLDIVELVRVNGVSIDGAEFRAWCLKHGSERIYVRIRSLMEENA